MAEAPAPAVQRELRLKFAVDGEAWFKVGGDGENCDAIERIDGGYEIHRGAEMVRVEASDVQFYRQTPRPGFAREQREAAAALELPSYAMPESDGTFSCSLCGANHRTMHGLRIHHGRAHAEGTDANDERW